MNESTANDFYERLVEGTDYEETIELTHGSGAKLTKVKMAPVNKRVLANVINKLPEEMFDAVEGAESPEEAEEMLEEGEGGSMSLQSMSSDTVEAFEDLLSASLSHEELTQTQMDQIIENLDFSALFELGGQVMDMSFSDGNAIKDFRVQE